MFNEYEFLHFLTTKLQDKYTWRSCLDMASRVTWQEWNERNGSAARLEKLFTEFAQKFLALSQKNDIEFDRACRNAIALTRRENVPFIRIALSCVDKLSDNTIPKIDSLKAAPKKSPEEKIIGRYVLGSFEGTSVFFENLIAHARQVSEQQNLVRNLFHFSSGNDIDICSLILYVHKKQNLKKISQGILCSGLKLYCEDVSIQKKIEKSEFQNLPFEWQKSIISEDKLVSKLLSQKLVFEIDQNPLKFPASPSSILFDQLKNELKVQRAKTSFKLSTFKKIIESDKIAEAFDNEYEWEISNSARLSIEFEKQEFEKPTIKKFGKPNKALAHYYLLHSLSSSDYQEKTRDGAEKRSIKKVLDRVSNSFQLALIRSSQGCLQKSFFEQALSLKKCSEVELCKAFLSGEINENTDLDVLLRCLEKASETELSKINKRISAVEFLLIKVFQRSDYFSNYIIQKVKRGNFDKLVFGYESSNLMEAYPDKSALFFDAQLYAIEKQKTDISKKAFLDLLAVNYPKTCSIFFRNRPIHPSLFSKILRAKAFENVSLKFKEDILSLKTVKGYSAFAVAVSQEKLDQDLVNSLSTSPKLKKAMALKVPYLISDTKVELSDHLFALTANPNFISQRLSDALPEELEKCLPKVRKKLAHKTRVFAALELAALSDLTIFPALLHLSSLIKPPFDKDVIGTRYDHLYLNYDLPKKSGGKRQISAPAPILKKVQRGLLQLFYKEQLSESATGFVPGLNIADNAKRHVGNDVVVNADIKNFFPSTTYKQVFDLSFKLANGKLSPFSRRLLAELCCQGGYLATGSPTSPAVSNLILKRLDSSLSKIASNLTVNYSRYADDLTFSGGDAAVWMLKPLKVLLAQNGYELDDKKTNIFRKGRRQSVTGLVVNEQVNMARPLKKKLRAAVHARVEGRQPIWSGKPISDVALKGHISFLSMVSPEYGLKLRQKLETFLASNGAGDE